MPQRKRRAMSRTQDITARRDGRKIVKTVTPTSGPEKGVRRIERRKLRKGVGGEFGQVGRPYKRDGLGGIEETINEKTISGTTEKLFENKGIGSRGKGKKGKPKDKHSHIRDDKNIR